MTEPMTASGALLRVCTVLLSFAAMLGMVSPASAQGPSPQILAPTDGQFIVGQVPVRVTTDVPNSTSAELDFAYASDATPNGFLLQTASLPVTDQVMALWDTTAITDGDYLLRLRVSLVDGSTQDVTETVKVRNYTALPTPSPAATDTPTPFVEGPTAIVIVPTETATA